MKRAVKSELPDKKCGVVEMRAGRAPGGRPDGQAGADVITVV